eukprot:11671414-Alexandrium_andersonii.AAC.1
MSNSMSTSTGRTPRTKAAKPILDDTSHEHTLTEAMKTAGRRSQPAPLDDCTVDRATLLDARMREE